MRLEWLKFFALFFNKEAEANAIFDAAVARYAQLRAAAAAAAKPSKPLVAFVRLFESFDPDWGRSFYEVSFAPYKVEYVDAAGGRVPDVAALSAKYADHPAEVKLEAGHDLRIYNLDLAPSVLREILADVEYVIDESYLYSPSKQSDAFDAFVASFKFTGEEGACWAVAGGMREDRRKGENKALSFLDWWAGGERATEGRVGEGKWQQGGRKGDAEVMQRGRAGADCRFFGQGWVPLFLGLLRALLSTSSAVLVCHRPISVPTHCTCRLSSFAHDVLLLFPPRPAPRCRKSGRPAPPPPAIPYPPTPHAAPQPHLPPPSAPSRRRVVAPLFGQPPAVPPGRHRLASGVV